MNKAAGPGKHSKPDGGTSVPRNSVRSLETDPLKTVGVPDKAFPRPLLTGLDVLPLISRW